MLYTAKFKSWTIIILLATSVSCGKSVSLIWTHCSMTTHTSWPPPSFCTTATCSSSNLHDYLFTQEGSGDTTHLLLPTTHVNPTTTQPSYSSMSVESNVIICSCINEVILTSSYIVQRSTPSVTTVITSTVTVESMFMLPLIVVSSVLGFIVIIMSALFFYMTVLYLKLKRYFKGIQLL